MAKEKKTRGSYDEKKPVNMTFQEIMEASAKDRKKTISERQKNKKPLK